ncbi:MAG TPA: patatin-like phospholipase family protein, partial [Thermoanaerobaculia bacterium]|nr:patatin-like phospholipase family protein [Thermoanaerobaculia bacterium]
MALGEFAAELESDPVVFELGNEGDSGEGNAVLKIWGVTGRVEELQVTTGPVPDSGAFHFTVDEVKIIDRSDDPDVPVWARIPMTCSGGAEGQEAASTLEVTVTFAGGPPTVYRVGLVASVNHVLPLWKVLREEYAALKPAWAAELASDPVFADPEKGPGDKLAALFALVHRQAEKGDDLTGLSLSGGGIRSATFNLGVLQGLARIGILDKFDYLSSVSGGGYIASWLSGWIYRAGGLAKVLPELRSAQRDPDQPEAETITHLRQYSNYLTPKLGFLSGDAWTAVAIVVRNLLLNQLVLLPVLAAILALPLVAVSKTLWMQHLIPGPDFLFWAASLLGGVAFFFMSLLRASAQPRHKPGETPRPSPPFLTLGLLPVVIAIPLILLAVYEYGQRRPGHVLYTPEVVVRCLIWSIVVPMIAMAASVPAQRRMFGREMSVLKVDLA